MKQSSCSHPAERQLNFPFKREAKNGGRLGRKPSPDSGVSHAKRANIGKHGATHITIKWCADLPTLREDGAASVIVEAFLALKEKGGVRVYAFSIQHDHVHLVCEADSREVLANRMQGLKVRMAKRLNKLWDRSGTVFADRYHREDLHSPTQVRNAIRYVLQNVFRHRCEHEVPNHGQPDRYSSGRWFDGWRESHLAPIPAEIDRSPIARPTSWLLRHGWREYGGLISIHERPMSARR